MSAILLKQGDPVSYKSRGRKMRGVVADILPFTPQREVPIKKRTKVTWYPRKVVRKLVPKHANECELGENWRACPVCAALTFEHNT